MLESVFTGFQIRKTGFSQGAFYFLQVKADPPK